tara:strand:+ start:241 stop:705 length:465 start_codon:yes stop_codon:yes gene_type:complete
VAKLTEEMKRMVVEQKLGLVATVNEDGTPNLSPKATFVVTSDEQIVFGDLRSPNTQRNVEARGGMELNFVDPIARKGFRAKGQARYVPNPSAEFDELLPRFAEWGTLTERMRGVFVLDIERAVSVTSPAYDDGADETELRQGWLKRFNDLNADL